MADHATTLYRMVLSCDPSEPLLIGGWGSDYCLPYDDNYTLLSGRVFHEPIQIGWWFRSYYRAVAHELSQLPRVLPFE